jgi:hypothetical protein
MTDKIDTVQIASIIDRDGYEKTWRRPAVLRGARFYLIVFTISFFEALPQVLQAGGKASGFS